MALSLHLSPPAFFLFFFNDTATTEIYTLSLHDALPIFEQRTIITLILFWIANLALHCIKGKNRMMQVSQAMLEVSQRSEEHTSELQSPCNLVCRLLLEKKKKAMSNLPNPHSHITRTHAP